MDRLTGKPKRACRYSMIVGPARPRELWPAQRGKLPYCR